MNGEPGIFTYRRVSCHSGCLFLESVAFMDRLWITFLGRHKPHALVQNGQILQKNLKRAQVTIDDLLAQLRLKKVHNLSDVASAVLEPMGELSVLKTPESSPITRSMMKLPINPAGMGAVLIYDGKVERQHLYALGLKENWLEKEIAEKGFSIPQVLLPFFRKI